MSDIAYCGLLCHECPLFIATQNNDQAAMEQLAIECSNEHMTFTAEDMFCEGCHHPRNDSSKMCGDCENRKCAIEKAVENCGVCSDYPCDIVERRVPEASENRERLNEIARCRN